MKSADEQVLTTWTIYRRPLDHPAHFVVRGFDLVAGHPLPRFAYQLAGTLGEARAKVPPGLYRVPRDPSDHPSVVETWL